MTTPSPWRATVLTLFPEMFPGPLGVSLAGRALAGGLWQLEARDIRASATDRRAREVGITPKGRRLLERARGLISETEDEVLDGLTAKERGELVGLLRRALESAPTQPLWSAAEGD